MPPFHSFLALQHLEVPPAIWVMDLPISRMMRMDLSPCCDVVLIGQRISTDRCAPYSTNIRLTDSTSAKPSIAESPSGRATIAIRDRAKIRRMFP